MGSPCAVVDGEEDEEVEEVGEGEGEDVEGEGEEVEEDEEEEDEDEEDVQPWQGLSRLPVGGKSFGPNRGRHGRDAPDKKQRPHQIHVQLPGAGYQRAVLHAS